MNGALVAVVLSWVFIVAGSVFVLIGGIGLIRLFGHTPFPLGVLTVNAGVPVLCTLTDPRQKPEDFEPGAAEQRDVIRPRRIADPDGDVRVGTQYQARRDAQRAGAPRRLDGHQPIVDAGMRELWHTGWMHNRVRMVVASFLTKNLGIHWIEGARWFWDTLVDADLASNTLGWQWTAGCGADAAPYFRIFNPVTQAEKFDPDGHYIREWLPELARVEDRWIHTPWLMDEQVQRDSGCLIGRNYPEPLVDHMAAARLARARGSKCGLLRLVSIWPFPEQRIRELADQVGAFVVPEINMGQMVLEVERCAAGKAPAVHVPHAGGGVHDPGAICKAIVEAAR